ncbi:alpha/beta fold hydrolase [Hoeflea sp. Naph1]|uniref:alpha/beta fold hydrolase n=1 Tax=Hoeflea sp. Naph1 TaxID=3388653 RepID=UPI00398FA5ED
MRYSFSNCVLDSDRHLLVRDGKQVRVEPQVFDLLHLLVRNAGVLVTRDQIIDEIWGGRIVSESSISARINAARKAVGDNGKEQSIVKTVPRRGLQLGTSVSMDREGEPAPSPALSDRQRVRFAKSDDGTSIAYATSGHGPMIMRAGHFLTHLEMDWKSLIWRPYLNALGQDHTLVRYDQRGTGLSDPILSNTVLDSHVADLEAVANAAGLDRFPLIALSQGVPIAIQFAANHPERVSCLVLYGGYTEGRALRDGGQSSEAADAMMTLMREGWGKPESAFMRAFTSLFCPEASLDQLADLVDMQLASTSPENAGRIRMAIDRFTVVDQLENIQVPTLVIHSRNDSVHPLSEGQKLASNIARAELVVLESANHILLPGENAWSEWARATLEFLDRTSALE